MPSILYEKLLSLKQVASKSPAGRKGRPMHISTVMRWISKGVKTACGPVRLEAIRMGGRWLTSEEALERFVAAQTPDLTKPVELPRSVAARTRASRHAENELKRLGF
jgi:hypothetical protein